MFYKTDLDFLGLPWNDKNSSYNQRNMRSRYFKITMSDITRFSKGLLYHRGHRFSIFAMKISAEISQDLWFLCLRLRLIPDFAVLNLVKYRMITQFLSQMMLKWYPRPMQHNVALMSLCHYNSCDCWVCIYRNCESILILPIYFHFYS